MKNTVNERKATLEGIEREGNEAKGSIRDLEDTAAANTRSAEQNEKLM